MNIPVNIPNIVTVQNIVQKYSEFTVTLQLTL